MSDHEDDEHRLPVSTQAATQPLTDDDGDVDQLQPDVVAPPEGDGDPISSASSDDDDDDDDDDAVEGQEQAAADEEAAGDVDAGAAAAAVSGEAAASTPTEVLKRPPSSYFLFCSDHRAEVKATVGGSVSAVAKAMGERWKQLTAEQRSVYEDRAKQAKADYKQAVAAQVTAAAAHS